MALNKLKKWIGTQLFASFMDDYNSNVDATNAAIDLVEDVSDDVHGLGNRLKGLEVIQSSGAAIGIVYNDTLPDSSIYIFVTGRFESLYIISRFGSASYTTVIEGYANPITVTDATLKIDLGGTTHSFALIRVA